VSNLYPIVNLWAERFYYSVGVGTAAIAVAGAMNCWAVLARRMVPARRQSALTTVWIVLIVAAWAAALTDFVRILECRTSLSLWRRTVRTVPTSGTALSTLAKYELDAGNYDRVEALAEAMQRHDPWVFRVHWILGENAFRQQKWSEAVAHFEKAVSVPPPAPGDEIPAALALIRSYLQLGRRDLAQSVLARFMQQYPKNPSLLELQRRIKAARDDSPSSPTAAKISGNP
ncbi:MAG: tetratricopeptide repeat protein, partial [Candidatus Sumerlaeia bacterium]|nr:tetratricopeptide repeat protein [Candidatus Sumerlaeia bacterium]